jgi:FlaA1/EpsC-like NDP-sugar epimerase
MLNLRNRHLFLIDLVLLPAAAVLAFVLRLDVVRFQANARHALLFIAVAVPVKLIVFRYYGLYGRYWRYASMGELMLITTATGISSVIAAALLFGLALPLSGLIGFPRSIPIIDGLLTLFVVGGPRYAIRVAGQRRQRVRRQGLGKANGVAPRRVLVMGAGDAGAMIVKEMQANPQLGLLPVGFADDDPQKAGVRIHGVPVLGPRERIAELAGEYEIDEVIIAMPTVPGSVIRQILEICNQAGLPAHTVPGLYDIISGEVSVSQIREVDIEDLLRREPVRTDLEAVQALIRGRRVLVTGAGGSIGSELCRQIARAGADSLFLVGHGEHSIYRINRELRERFGSGICIVPLIADARDRARLEQLFAEHRPELVFHAAAHKHVPLMETNACEAVTNNVLGTRNLVEAAEAAGVSHLILISTDKAVNPASIMGVTKRVAEMIVHQAARRNGRCFAAVRFGNVLGSRGSVIPEFKRQIAQGGPVTVTHPDMHRYFMTIPEAVQLVLQAAAIGRGGEVFVLDMGEPVCMVDLATDLIRLSGLRPKVAGQPGGSAEWDIEVVFSGVRPGEKLAEELFVEGEEYGRTRHEKIFVAMNGQDPMTRLEEQVEQLVAVAQQGDEGSLRRLLAEIVPEYQGQQV